MFKKLFKEAERNDQAEVQEENDPEEKVQDDGSDHGDEENQLEEEESNRRFAPPAPSGSFLSMIKEKRKINEEKFQEYAKEIEEFAATSNEQRQGVQLELGQEFEKFFKEAANIMKQTRGMEEARALEMLDLQEEDTFKGTFSFGEVKYGESTMREVSNIFRPRRQIGGKQFRQDGDDFEVCCNLVGGGREPPVNYDPLSEREYKHWQKHYIGLTKTFNRLMDSEEMVLDLTKVWVGDVIAMKLLAEFVWRHTDMISAIGAEKSKGFNKKNCLMFMQALKECRTLRSLDFDDTQLCKEGSAGLALIAKVSENLECVTLQNSFTMDAGACFWGLALASGCPGLQTLDLSNGRIGASGAVAIAIGLSKHHSLRVLNLSDNRVQREGCQRIGEALLVNPILEELNLSGNNIGSRGAASIAAFVIHPRCKLKTLNLSNNDIGRRGGKALSVGMSMNKSILNLDLTANDLGDVGCAGFGICLERNSTLKELNLSDCDITDLGAAALAIGLKTNCVLRKLILSNQIIADAGCAELARMISENPNGKLQKLRVLDLSSNAIRDVGAKALAEMLKVNRSLSELRLNDNEIGNDGAITLGMVLADKLNPTLKTLDVSDNPIAAEVSIDWFAKAEKRLVSQNTQRIDVRAQGTTLARGNLRGCGVIVMRSEMAGCYAFFMGAIALLGGWFDFASDIIVAINTVSDATFAPDGNTIYAALTVTFVVVPFLYILVVFSLPADDTDATLKAGPSVHTLPHSSSLLLGRMTPAGDKSMTTAKSFKDHLTKVASSSCDESRVMLFFINVFQTRIAYEIYLSYKAGVTTLALSSIRLAEVIFEAVPQSIIQLHIILSSSTLTKIDRLGSIFNPEDRSVLVLFLSVGFSVSVLANTLAGLFEEKFVVNWKRVAWVHEDLAYWYGFIISYLYHFSHYLLRGLTITLIASIYAPLLAAGFFAFGVLLRILIHYITKSERRRAFAVISYLVGVASWDTKLGSRLGFLFETIETVIVIAPLWMPLDVIQGHIAANPLAFQLNWYNLVSLVGPVLFTALLYSCWGLCFFLHFGFIEKIHPYSDVPQIVDRTAAEELARTPFEQLSKEVRENRRKGMLLKMTTSGSLRDTAKRAAKTTATLFHFGRGKKQEPAVAMVPEEAGNGVVAEGANNNDEADGENQQHEQVHKVEDV